MREEEVDGEGVFRGAHTRPPPAQVQVSQTSQQQVVIRRHSSLQHQPGSRGVCQPQAEPDEAAPQAGRSLTTYWLRLMVVVCLLLQGVCGGGGGPGSRAPQQTGAPEGAAGRTRRRRTSLLTTHKIRSTGRHTHTARIAQARLTTRAARSLLGLCLPACLPVFAWWSGRFSSFPKPCGSGESGYSSRQ